nr:glycogen synthase GlgA [Hirschia baltica]
MIVAAPALKTKESFDFLESQINTQKSDSGMSGPIRVLSVTSELYPLIKTGGLADVTGALPLALKDQGVEVRSFIPGYRSVMSKLENPRVVKTYNNLFGSKAAILADEVAGHKIYVLDCPDFFDRSGGPYLDENGADWEDNWQRFGALSKAAADVALGKLKEWEPQVIHAHDWQSALSLAYVRYANFGNIPRIMTIHNLAFQGRYDAKIFKKLGLPKKAWAMNGVEYYGGIGYMKAGLSSADVITTVSPTYAREIRRPENGMGLDGLINHRENDLYGILNGIDDDVWNPPEDPYITKQYSARNYQMRRQNRFDLETEFGLFHDEDPLFVICSRMTWQKGVDMLLELLDELVPMGAKFAVLGQGDNAIERGFLAASQRHPGRIGVKVGYEEPIAHRMQAGGDAILIPSRFEPCGLTQLYGLRYGCVPVVTRVGGLADTIIDANEASVSLGCATGVQFYPPDPFHLKQAVVRTIKLYNDKTAWKSMQRAGMRSDFSWGRSAARYVDLYRQVIANYDAKKTFRPLSRAIRAAL